MLPRHHRLTRPSDISAVVSRGRKKANRLVVVYVNRSTSDVTGGAARAAVITGKNVGGAPQRNRVKRQIRHILAELIREGALDSTSECVVRALPGSAEVPWVELHRALTDALADVVAETTRHHVRGATNGPIRRA